MSLSQRDLVGDEKHLYRVLRSDRFLKMEGLSKEVPFFIYHFPPAWADDVEEMRERVKSRLLTDDGIRVDDLDLYDIAIGLLRERGVWDRVLQLEPTMEKAEFREVLQGMLDPHDHLAPAIRSLVNESSSDMVFLTGLGEVFPFIRTHTVLENLQSVITGMPMLAWFPGAYEFTHSSGHQLRALNLSASDSYYRAKDILEQEA